MSNKKSTTSAQGAGVVISEEQKSQALARFDNPSSAITSSQAEQIFASGVFDKEGIDVTTEMLNKEFWESKKDEPIPFICSGIHTEPEGRSGAYDVATGTAVIDGEIKTVSIPQTVVVSSIRQQGLGAYLITYKGMKRGKENDYASFGVKLQSLFKKD